MVDFAITKLKFSGTQEIDFEAGSLIIFIGANSAGKSRALREIRDLLWGQAKSDSENLKVVKHIDTEEYGEKEEWFVWFRSNFHNVNTPGGIEIRTIGAGFNEQTFKNTFGTNNYLATMGRFLTRSLDTESRLSLTRPVDRINRNEGIQNEFHQLLLDSSKLEPIAKEVSAVFRKDLMPDYGGRQYRLFTGNEPIRTKDQDRVSPEYLTELYKNPPLEDDGDGIRSFVACLLATKLTPNKIFLIDEPEVFLHPPQARRLGNLLAETAHEENRQVIISTHSSDIIKGALDFSGKVHICRLERRNDVNNAYSLNNQELRTLWKKPLLKSTDAIQGAFHRGVIICEADADCRFYEGLLRRLETRSRFNDPPDIHFVHGGGKGELSTLTESYEQLYIPTAVIADFDMLQNRDELKNLVTALRGKFADIESLYNRVSKYLKDVEPSNQKISASEALRMLADDIDKGKSPTGNDISSLTKILQGTREWSKPKEFGITALKGSANRECDSLLKILAEMGLFIVREGELESWERSLASNKAEWIIEALKNIEQDTTSFSQAQAFVNQIANYLGVSDAFPGESERL